LRSIEEFLTSDNAAEDRFLGLAADEGGNPVLLFTAHRVAAQIPKVLRGQRDGDEAKGDVLHGPNFDRPSSVSIRGRNFPRLRDYAHNWEHLSRRVWIFEGLIASSTIPRVA
jgi:hypothetical protein